jgi:alpha-mannosidase
MFDDNEDPWGWGLTTVGSNYREMQPQVVGRVVERGSLYTRLENIYILGNSKVCVYYKVYNNKSYIDVDVNVIWNDEGKGLKLAIGYANQGSFIGQTAFGTQTYELEREQCAQKFCGIDDGENVLSLYANYLGGCSIEQGVLYVTLFNGSVYCAHPIDDLPIVDDQRCNDFLEVGRHSFSFRLALDKRESLEKNAIEFTQKPYVLNGYPHGTGKTEREGLVTLSNTNIALASLRKVGESVWAVRLFNNTAQGADCICRAFGKEITLSFGKYEVKTLYYDGSLLKEDESMILL